jgi:uncharacterized membrane protein YphA (DoxX/SURF4 family)
MSPRHTVGVAATGIAALSALAVGPGPVVAHIDYVTDETSKGDPIALLASVFSEPLNVALLAGGAVAVIGTALVYLRLLPARRDVAVFRETMESYRDLMPWLLRLSFGLPLVGAGFAGYLFSPSVEPFIPLVFAPSRLFQIGVGFLLLFGLATRAVAVFVLAVYLLELATDPRLLLANEYVTGMVVLVLIGSGRPSADHVLDRIASAEGTVYGEFDPVHRASAWFNRRVDPYQRYVPLIVRVGLGLNFLFLGVTQKLLSPEKALAVVEKYGLTGLIPVDAGLWVVGAGLTEAALGVALLLGVFTRAGSVVALTVFTLTLFGLPDDPVLAHITLFGLGSYLLVTGSGPFAVDEWLQKHVSPQSRDASAAADD